eukprot:1187422-Prorocentrum_minimum.AAC.4
MRSSVARAEQREVSSPRRRKVTILGFYKPGRKTIIHGIQQKMETKRRNISATETTFSLPAERP